MKKTVLTFGLISGAVSSVLMLSTALLLDRIGFDKGVILGYTGDRSFLSAGVLRDSLIPRKRGWRPDHFWQGAERWPPDTLISCLCYLVTWEIVYFKLMPGFAEKYTNYVMEQVRASGASQQVIDAKMQEMKNFKALYDNPLFNAAVTFLEPLPIGLVVSLISAATLRRRKPKNREQVVSEPLRSS